MQKKPPSDADIFSALPVFVARSAKVVSITAVIGAVAGLALYTVHQPRWTAKMLIKIGQVTTVSDSGSTVRPVEPQLTAIDQYNQPVYRLNVLKDLGLPEPDSSSTDSTLIFDSLRATPAKGPDLINVQVNAHSPELAAKALNVSFRQLGAAHLKMFEIAVGRMKAELVDTSAKLVIADREYARAFDMLKASESQGSNASTSRDLFATNIVSTISKQVLDLRQRKAQLEEGLESIRTYPTSIVGIPYVPTHPSSPGRTVFIGLGALVGIIAGFAFVVFRRIRLD